MVTAKKIMCVIGTRPEALKMIPIIEKLHSSELFEVQVVVTGQHREILDQMLSILDIEIAADFKLMTKNQSLASLTANLIHKFDEIIQKITPDMIIAQGDTTTTMVAGLISFYYKLPFAHIEAGLRSTDIYSPFPEELNRQISGRLATLHFAPTEKSRDNLIREGISNNIFSVGNTVIDTLQRYVKTESSQDIKDDKKIILVTCHRRENFGKRLENICEALLQIVNKFPFVEILYPVHPNPNVKDIVYDKLNNHEQIKLIEPLGYQELVEAMQSCYLVLTDSGGLQEEGPALNKPVLVMRTETERPEGIEAGVAKLVGVETNDIIREVSELLENPTQYSKMQKKYSPYGDGLASERIIEVISNYFDKEDTSDIGPRSEFKFID
ncbi:MAG: UDP-N-acetylglucosamine 2-epimerase (non-hydrolyzing) [Legionellales bacterium]|nr:UDP-N-acetylglucosamine 2-epimerase (non-hydrolyzing) [Legionellales bacterium]